MKYLNSLCEKEYVYLLVLEIYINYFERMVVVVKKP